MLPLALRVTRYAVRKVGRSRRPSLGEIDEESRAAISAVIPDALRGRRHWNRGPPPSLEPDRFHTLGRWGNSL